MTQGTETAAPEAAPWRLRLQDGKIFGPATLDALRAWAMDGRVQPGYQVSTDGENWKPAHSLAELEMFWSVEMPDGSMFGPINLRALAESVADGALKPSARLRDLRTGQLTTVAVKMNDITGASVAPASGPAGGADARAETERETAALRFRLDSAEKQLATAAAKIAESERAAAARIAALEKDLSLARAEAGRSAELAKQAADRLQEAAKEAATAKSVAEAGIASLTARADDLQARLDEAGRELLALLPKDKSETIDWIAGKRSAAQAGKSPHASSVLQKIRQDVEQRTAEMHALQARQAELEEALARSERTDKGKAERVAFLESENPRLQAELNAGSARLAELEKALSETRAAAAAEADRVNRLREEKKSLATQNARVVENAQVEIRSLRDELQKALEANASRLAEKDSGTAKLAARVKELEDSTRASAGAAVDTAAALKAVQADAQVAAVREKQQRSFLKGMIRELQSALEQAEDELAAERDRRLEDMRRAVRLERELASLGQEGRRAPDQPQPAAGPDSKADRAAAHPLASLELQAERELKVWHSSRKDARPAGKTADRPGLSAERE